MTIKFNCSDKLLSILSNILENDKKEYKLTTMSDIIEEALLSYYKISISDLQKYNKNIYNYNIILDSLNNNKTIKETAIKLNISERTLYRYIKKHNILKDSYKKYYIDLC